MYKFLMMINKLMGPSEENDNQKFNELGAKINEILTTYVSPIMIALGGAAAIYIVVLGVQYAKSESDDKKAEVKKRIINMAIGLLVMLGLVLLCNFMPWEELVELFGYAGATPEE